MNFIYEIVILRVFGVDGTEVLGEKVIRRLCYYHMNVWYIVKQWDNCWTLP